MPFQSPLQSINVTSLADGESELLDRVPSEAEAGWDSMRDTYLLRNDAAGTDPDVAIASFKVRGSQISGKTMWVVSRSARCVALGLFVVEVVSMGLLSARGDRVRYDAGANSQSGQNILAGGAVRANLETQESQVTCDIEYIVTSGLTPGNASFYTAEVGTAVDPPAEWEPTVKPSTWSFLTEYTYHHPNGWVLMSVSAENLPGLDTVWLLRDRYQYIYAISP